MRHTRIIIAAVVLAAAATVGGITVATSANGSNSPAADGRSTGAGFTAGNPSATVQTATATVRGTRETILVDAHGLPLYTYQPDTATTSNVTGQLAVLWPPLLSATPTVDGLTGTLAVVPTTHGRQVAYKGHLLYTFVQDRPGEVTGQGVQSFFVATPDPAGASSSGASTGSSTSGNGY